MADFCKQCSIEMFGEDYGDLKNLGNTQALEDGYGWGALCEGCGPTLVDNDGACIADCLEHHGDIK